MNCTVVEGLIDLRYYAELGAMTSAYIFSSSVKMALNGRIILAVVCFVCLVFKANAATDQKAMYTLTIQR